MSRGLGFVAAVAVWMSLALPVSAAPYENGQKHTPGVRMPVGQYMCSLGSYRYKPCTVSEREGRFYLTVTEGARFPFEGELLPTDEKGQLVLLGAPTSAGELCPTCADEALGVECAGDVAEKAACARQPVHASLRQGKGGVWTGELLHYLVRAVDGDPKKGWYRLGLTETFRVRKAK